MKTENLLKKFATPPSGYGEVAFFWWHGDVITKEKLTWILNQLEGSAISGIQINYCHGDTGGQQWGLTMESEPRPLSSAWWDLVGWFIEQCKPMGISVSLSDYTLGAPGQGFYVDSVLQKHPEYLGQELQFHDGVITPVTVPYSLNPMVKGVGKDIADEFYGAFERHFPQECGKGINYFFSDELNFNLRGNLWCDDFEQEFLQRKGYDIVPKLRAIFEDIGDETPKIRLDYYDVIVQLSEKKYFKPIYDWHQKRKMVFGCDHGGRGKDVTEFGDYFRTMKWNQAPGNDQPRLASDIIKNKVSSSIAHLYHRKRTWLEGFYSSGWGTSSAQVADAVFRNFAMGHNLLSLHGLYYSMQGSMWEWAPPCNHFHMPYWSEMPQLLDCTQRLSWLLSRGHHCCDVGIVYPVADMEADIQHGKIAVKTAFDAGEALYKSGIDFDFVDFESIERATINEKVLRIAPSQYQVMIVPDMRAVRYKMLKKLLRFAERGGLVVVIGKLPQESDRAGRNDLHVLSIVHKLREYALCIDIENLVKTLQTHIVPDFYYESTQTPFVQHRKIGKNDLYFVYGLPKETRCTFRTQGTPLILDVWTGKASAVKSSVVDDNRIAVCLPRGEKEVNLLLFVDSDQHIPVEKNIAPRMKESHTTVLTASGEWMCQIRPTLDNTYGDYRLPAFAGYIGPEVRAARYCITQENCAAPDYDDSRWQTCTFGYGPQMWVLPDTNVQEPMIIASNTPPEGSRPFYFSWRYGMQNDIGNQGSYHGLKAKISNDFIGLGEMKKTGIGSSSVYEGSGGWYVFTTVWCESAQCATISFGAMKADKIWCNHTEEKTQQLSLRQGTNMILLHFPQCGRTHVVLHTANEFQQKMSLAMKWFENPSVLPFDASPEFYQKSCWYRFKSPPGMQSLKLRCKGNARVYCNGTRMQKNGDVFTPIMPGKRPAQIAVQITQERGYYAGAAILEPIAFQCGEGILSVGDWSEIDGLRCYSGGIAYTRSVTLVKPEKVLLQLGAVVSSVRVTVNGKQAAVLTAPPFDADITNFVHEGENSIELLVHNTLANHMSTIPTEYGGSLVSGLLGTAEVE